MTSRGVVYLGSAQGSILLQVGGVVVVLAPEDTVAAAAAYRVEVPILGVVDLLAEAGVGGVLATGDGGQSGRLRGARDFDSRLAGNPRLFQSVRAAGLGGLPC